MTRFLALIAATLLLIPAFAIGDCTRRVQKVVVAQNHKVVLVPVEVQRDYYYSIDPHYQQNALAAEIKQLRAELRQVLGKKQSPTPKQIPTEQGPTPNVEATEPVAGKYQNDKLLATVNNSCSKCHGVTSKQTRLVTKDGKALADVPAGKVWEAFGLVNSGEMPKAADQLNDEDVKLFYEWAKNARK